MKFVIGIALLWGMYTTGAWAQSGKAKIEGSLLDTDGGAVEYATVVLHRLPDSTVVRGGMADEEGKFVFTELPYGQFYVVVTNLGYYRTVSESFSLSGANLRHILKVTMPIEVYDSEAVTIEGQRSLIRQEAGSTVVDIENSTLNAGQSIAEALKRVPGVTVDKDGLVTLKGKEGAMIMIDGKPLYMDAAQIGTLLKSIPADQVKEVEVLTSPSAKYDAAGNAGMINIKLKKGAYEGLNGSATASMGHGRYPKANAGINLSYKKKRISLSAGYQYLYKKNYSYSYFDRQYPAGDSSYTTIAEYARPENVHSGMFNGSYEVSKKGTLSWDANIMNAENNWRGGSQATIMSSTGQKAFGFNTDDRSYGSFYNINTGITYQHKFDTVGTELKIGGEYKTMSRLSRQRLYTTYTDHNDQPTGTPLDYSANIPLGLDQLAAQADFIRMLPARIKMEAGIKYNYVETGSNSVNTLYPPNHFVYTEHIQAGYMMLHKKISKWSLQAGLRLENTQSKGNQKTMDTVFTRQYANLFPSGSISYQATEKTTYTLLYSKRIARPKYTSLNPYTYYSDPYNIYSGNPNLLPQYTHHTEFAISNWNGVLLTTLNYSYTESPQADVWLLDNNTLITNNTSRNLEYKTNMGISLALNLSPFKWWTMSNYTYLYNNKQVGDFGSGRIELSRTAWMFNAAHTFKMPYQIAAELSGNYSSPGYYGGLLYRQVWQISAGVQKRLFKDKLSAKVSITDMFWSYTYKGEGMLGDVKVRDELKWDNRVLMFSLTYRFGRKLGLDDDKNAPTMGAGGGRH
jgi:iron complex outermembrane receptor protein